MIIEFIKFGEDLHGRPQGKDAYDSIIARLGDIRSDEEIIVDFKGLKSCSTSWLDEVLTPLQNRFGDRLVLRNVTNLSAKLSLDVLRDVGGKKFRTE
ncbi:MAG: hypothetical protein A3B91_03845 [Candidatus Yanofskybacteria bacterium RIFCSPHIGHO2_02_FULL_41_29]|uniref:DUF4325 domain-containing protein n=1 Tax=Candidatus Yanofskybacteria bacterium RIFCSPHIGHO2_01_FULL_41_53 TaxID=1802663 RepID=A0A1F8EHA0_9BACT|nr:MAG: hypothetical protein A2650_05050 [Candidatus Yanofskybacteria bacterium RIFCSPHIGHO2_01_FULL_41_53]OGN10885.1 MAG: hypothetical protein A3B91_03845 [Candidatus Yanofskybacteria bacterium RIFCSPHIGHO2_02_FULL_41_29]OGN21764.1 MAG: hypothetical protein A2916_03365 [Candidatus Yanofskybacteria bacterium RIFCSPLOWO2_01_FULL_41_67]OGN29554.1 MAG: hypothetical protein A3H54_01485 [Candidatus Yanofskybacteria bacterium RIFCSPLOWO2_02_FULL_41_13]OGN36657.1 MAG: hypothetical protein A3F98_03050 